jgi:hypothetical protein
MTCLLRNWECSWGLERSGALLFCLSRWGARSFNPRRCQGGFALYNQAPGAGRAGPARGKFHAPGSVWRYALQLAALAGDGYPQLRPSLLAPHLGRAVHQQLLGFANSFWQPFTTPPRPCGSLRLGSSGRGGAPFAGAPGWRVAGCPLGVAGVVLVVGGNLEGGNAGAGMPHLCWGTQPSC